MKPNYPAFSPNFQGKGTQYNIVKTTTQFKKDYKLAMKRGLKIKLLEDAIPPYG